MKKFLIFYVLFISLATGAQTPKTLIVIGDSLTEGYGLAKESAFPALVEKELGPKWKVTNSGISGSTSASAPSRVKWAVKSNPQVILLALGANDGLRGLNPDEMKKNLIAAINEGKKAGIKILLAGIVVPPNYGKVYADRFSKVFPAVAKETNVPLYPFLLDGVGGNPALNLPDGLHPNEEGHKIIAKKIILFLKKELP